MSWLFERVQWLHLNNSYTVVSVSQYVVDQSITTLAWMLTARQYLIFLRGMHSSSQISHLVVAQSLLKQFYKWVTSELPIPLLENSNIYFFSLLRQNYCQFNGIPTFRTLQTNHWDSFWAYSTCQLWAQMVEIISSTVAAKPDSLYWLRVPIQRVLWCPLTQCET